MFLVFSRMVTIVANPRFHLFLPNSKVLRFCVAFNAFYPYVTLIVRKPFEKKARFQNLGWGVKFCKQQHDIIYSDSCLGLHWKHVPFWSKLINLCETTQYFLLNGLIVIPYIRKFLPSCPFHSYRLLLNALPGIAFCNVNHATWAATWRTNKMSVRPGKTQISLDIRPVWSESSQCTQWVAKDPRFLLADSQDWSDWADAHADLSLRWVHCRFVGFVLSRLTWLLIASFQCIASAFHFQNFW